MTPATCPECGGGQVAGRDVLTLHHDRTTCAIGKAEDQTAHADYTRAQRQYGWPFRRAATRAELALLAALGYEAATVAGIEVAHTPGVRVRTPIIDSKETP